MSIAEYHSENSFNYQTCSFEDISWKPTIVLFYYSSVPLSLYGKNIVVFVNRTISNFALVWIWINGIKVVKYLYAKSLDKRKHDTQSLY